MSAVDWEAAKTALEAVLPADTDNPIRKLGDAIVFDLDTKGAVYDEVFTVEASAAKDAGDAGYTTASTTRVTLLQDVTAAIDNAARVVEAAQVTAQAGLPTEFVGDAGTLGKYPLAPDTATGWDGTGSASATAGLTLEEASVPMLRLTAKGAGLWGNTVEARVVKTDGGTATLAQDGVSPIAGLHSFPMVAGDIVQITMAAGPSISLVTRAYQAMFTLEVRRGDYVESYSLQGPGDKIDVKKSLLLSSAEWLGDAPSFPGAIGWTSFEDGAGGAMDAVKLRAQRAAKLSEATAYVTLLGELTAALDTLRATSATYPQTVATGAYNGKLVATEFDHGGTTYLVAGTAKGVPAEQKPRELTVKQVEERLSDVVDRAYRLSELLPAP